MPSLAANCRSYPLHALRRFEDAEITRLLHAGDTEEPTAAGSEEKLLCRFCLAEITETRQAIKITGSHRHRCINPSGFSFLLGCFRDAPGCRAIGHPTLEHTWFPGHAWSLCQCVDCRHHLGWFFAPSGGAGFFGLILNRLITANKNGPSASNGNRNNSAQIIFYEIFPTSYQASI